jgi:acyl-coenzyme A synthetase/AMP-(fatty) acid ligase
MADAGKALEPELIDLCHAHLAHYKAPRRIDFRPELPRHDAGNIYTRLVK